MADNLSQKLQRLAERMAQARFVACLTGAGVSAESGVPTFRGSGGMWEGMKAEELATPEAFARDPVAVWRFYLWRRRVLQSVKPNPAHHALARMEQLCAAFRLTTQNVDGLHREAGSRRVVALHGDIWIDRCTRCGEETRAVVAAEMPPHCPACGAMCRPGVVWFGETLPPEALAEAIRAALSADIMLVVGTSGVVQPAASLVAWAREAGTAVVEVNLEATPLSCLADETVHGKAGEILPRVVEAWPTEGPGAAR
jgi:NAD-dependent deacetylase